MINCSDLIVLFLIVPDDHDDEHYDHHHHHHYPQPYFSLDYYYDPFYSPFYDPFYDPYYRKSHDFYKVSLYMNYLKIKIEVSKITAPK